MPKFEDGCESFNFCMSGLGGGVARTETRVWLAARTAVAQAGTGCGSLAGAMDRSWPELECEPQPGMASSLAPTPGREQPVPARQPVTPAPV